MTKKNTVIGEGGFGCVLHPNIGCTLNNGKTVKSSKKYIIKLMDKTDNLNELAIVESIKDIVKKIPNYKKYFVIKIESCTPFYFEKDYDLITRECKYFSSFSKKEVLDLAGLVMKYGGKRLDDYILNNSSKSFASRLLDFVENAIFPLNNKKVYHCDIKPANVVAYKRDIKLIDWGFAYLHNINIFQFQVPVSFKHYPLHFNMPLTVCLFCDSVNSYVQKLLRSGTGIPETASKVWDYVKANKRGHYNSIESMYHFLKSSSSSSSSLSLDEYATKVYGEVFTTYFDNDSFNTFEYFVGVYLPNVDLFGVITMYSSILHRKKTPSTTKYLFHYYSEYYTKPIDKMQLLSDLKKTKF
jgi:serine/threonine protein kinase